MSRDYPYSPIDWTLSHPKILYIYVSHIKTQKSLGRLLLPWNVIAINSNPKREEKAQSTKRSLFRYQNPKMLHPYSSCFFLSSFSTSIPFNFLVNLFYQIESSFYLSSKSVKLPAVHH